MIEQETSFGSKGTARRIRQKGGGRKVLRSQDSTLLSALDALIEPTVRGRMRYRIGLFIMLQSLLGASEYVLPLGNLGSVHYVYDDKTLLHVKYPQYKTVSLSLTAWSRDIRTYAIVSMSYPKAAD